LAFAISMTLNLKTLVYCPLLVAFSLAQAQETDKKKIKTYERRFQFSIFPGISTNGITSGSYFNKYSFNLFGGLSAGNHFVELGLITNSHFQSSTGFQLAGLANISGTNAYINLTLSEERALIHNDFEVNNQGVLVAGLLNYTLNHASGILFTGGFNHTGNDFKGFQVAGIGNSTGGFSSGVHIAGVYNVVNESVAGIQISTFFNFADGQLSGSQIALINKARWMKGKNSTPFTKARSLQIGLINLSREMHGTQIGLINFGGEMRGKQIGLINFFQRWKSKENANAGTPIGILNLGSFGSIMRLSVNEIFMANFEYTTGNCLNCTWTPAGPVGMPYVGRNKIKNQNALILGFDPLQDRWGFGYGFMKILTNKVTSAPSHRNETRLMSYGIKMLHLNRDKKFDRNFNVVTRVFFDVGKRFRSTYLFAGVALNYFVYDASAEKEGYTVRSVKIDTGRVLDFESKVWPGYTAGVQF
jgi:hypothetical protein